ncbi:unnamed protein product [Effrenium voratum]|nr:unnamed protein product [Effrenium voratum]
MGGTPQPDLGAQVRNSFHDYAGQRLPSANTLIETDAAESECCVCRTSLACVQGEKQPEGASFFWTAQLRQPCGTWQLAIVKALRKKVPDSSGRCWKATAAQRLKHEKFEWSELRW